MANIFNEQKTHFRGEKDVKALCGAHGHAVRKISTSSHNVTCLRCLKQMAKRRMK